MPQRYKVYPVPTVNIPALHPDMHLQNYELYLGDGEVLDVRTRCYHGENPEIALAQVLDLDGKIVRQIPFEQIILADVEIGE